MVNLMTRKLELFAPLSNADKELLDDIVQNSRTLPARKSIIREGDNPSDVHLVLEGFACRYKMVRNGDRQIFAYLIPGDFCDLNIFILKAMDHGIETLSPCKVVDIPRPRILELMQRPEIARAIWWATLVDEATLREWLVNLGQRDAAHRIAHLFCEIHLRLQSIGLTTDGAFVLPVTQGELGDTMGLSTVHVNRALQDLRAQGLITFKEGQLEILDIHRIRSMSGFNPNYLHLEGGKRDADIAAPS